MYGATINVTNEYVYAVCNFLILLQ